MATFKTFSVVVTDHEGATTTYSGAEGEKAYKQISHGEAVKAMSGENTETIIPYHAIVKAVVTLGTETVSMTDNACTQA